MMIKYGKKALLTLFILTVTVFSSAQISYSDNAQDNNSKIKAKTESVKKSEAQTVWLKFLKSMLLVTGSCGTIFLLLLAYKKIKRTPVIGIKQIDIEKNLNTPETVEDATKFVIEKF